MLFLLVIIKLLQSHTSCGLHWFFASSPLRSRRKLSSDTGIHHRYTQQKPEWLKDEIIRFCVGLAAEGQRLAEGQPVAVQTTTQIAEWFKGLVEMPASEET